MVRNGDLESDFLWDDDSSPPLPSISWKPSDLPELPPAKPPRPLARLIKAIWVPWLAMLWLFALATAPNTSPVLFVILLAVSWLGTGLAVLYATYSFKMALVRRAPSVLEQRNIGSLLWTWNLYAMVAATWDKTVRSDPELSEYADRLRWLFIAPVAIFGFAALASVLRGY